MSELQCELHVLRLQRRGLIAQLAIAALMVPVLFAGLWDAALVLVDTRWLSAIAVALLSWAVVRTVADMAATLEEPCPACSARFFGGLARAAAALPMPPTQCVNCHIDFDGHRATGRESDRSVG